MMTTRTEKNTNLELGLLRPALNVLFFIVLISLSACQTVTLPLPDGFAYYEKKQSPELLRAVSPDRVVYRVRAVLDEPEASLDFWKTALETHFKKSGYVIVEQKAVKAGSLPGESFIMATTHAGRDYTYALNVFVYKKGVVLIEVAGENAQFEKYRQQVAAAIATTDISKLDCSSCQISPLSVKTIANGMSQD